MHILKQIISGFTLNNLTTAPSIFIHFYNDIVFTENLGYKQYNSKPHCKLRKTKSQNLILFVEEWCISLCSIFVLVSNNSPVLFYQSIDYNAFNPINNSNAQNFQKQWYDNKSSVRCIKKLYWNRILVRVFNNIVMNVPTVCSRKKQNTCFGKTCSN